MENGGQYVMEKPTKMLPGYDGRTNEDATKIWWKNQLRCCRDMMEEPPVSKGGREGTEKLLKENGKKGCSWEVGGIKGTLEEVESTLEGNGRRQNNILLSDAKE